MKITFYGGRPEASSDRRTVYIGARVTPEQKEKITRMARECGMTASDYLVSRALNYEPKPRLTPGQEEILSTITAVRSDIKKFFAHTKGWSAKKRKDYLDSFSFTLEWETRLKDLANRVGAIIKDFLAENPKP